LPIPVPPVGQTLEAQRENLLFESAKYAINRNSKLNNGETVISTTLYSLTVSFLFCDRDGACHDLRYRQYYAVRQVESRGRARQLPLELFAWVP
jgi:hypothetical protein